MTTELCGERPRKLSSIPSRGKKILRSSKYPKQAWRPPCHLFNRYLGLFPESHSGRSVELPVTSLQCRLEERVELHF